MDCACTLTLTGWGPVGWTEATTCKGFGVWDVRTAPVIGPCYWLPPTCVKKIWTYDYINLGYVYCGLLRCPRGFELKRVAL